MNFDESKKSAYIAMAYSLMDRDYDFKTMVGDTIDGGRCLDYFLPEPQIRGDGIMISDFPKKNLRVYTFDLSQGREQYELWLKKLNPEPEIAQAFQEGGLGSFIDAIILDGFANIVTTSQTEYR